MMRYRAVSPITNIWQRIALCALLFTVMRAPAVALDDSPFSIGGFGTLGATRTTSDQAEYVRDLSQGGGARKDWDGRVDSILGLQGNWRLSTSLEAVIQATSRYRYDKTFTPEISWAYLKYDPTPQIGLRAGRLGTEFFMLADSRMVGYSFLTVRPTGDFFWYLPFLSIDGGDITATLPVGEDILRGKLFYGVSDASIPLGDRLWKIDGSAMVGGYLEYQEGGWVFRASYANIRFKTNMPIDKELATFLPSSMVEPSRQFLATENTRSHYYSLGAMYDSGPWQIQLMANKIRQGSQIFESSWSVYVLAGYRIGQVTPYLGISRVLSESRSNRLNPVVSRIMADSHSNQYTTIVGARWDVARNVALKAQWDGIHGKHESILPVRMEQPGWTGSMDVLSLTMDFVF